jgi:hypothetical protein
VISDAVGEVRVEVPRDRESTFEPQIVKNWQRRLADVDEIVLSLYAKGTTTGKIYRNQYAGNPPNSPRHSAVPSADGFDGGQAQSGLLRGLGRAEVADQSSDIRVA